MKNYLLNLNQPFHLVSLSPWPLLCSWSVWMVMVGVLNYLNEKSLVLLINGFFLFILVLFQWWRDVIRESTYLGFHTFYVMKGLKMGMILFIISEVFFFISFFWSFFHFSLSPSIDLGMVWPPQGLILFDPMGISLLNTIILVSSGVSLTFSHVSLINLNYKNSVIGLFLTLILGIYFVIMQYIEYNESYFSMSDSVYGSIFFLMTGFHGMHVMVGFIFLLVMFIRLMKGHFSNKHHLGFEFSCWYWHFVDVVWLFLYLFVYWWVY